MGSSPTARTIARSSRPDETMTRLIRIAASVIARPDGYVLVVRKHGTTAFMQPGGKIDGAETALAAVRRELYEELQIEVAEGALDYLGHFSALAANEPGATVDAEIFTLEWGEPVSSAAEIEEIRWVDPAIPGDIELAALTRDHIFPAWMARRNLPPADGG